MAEKEGLPLWSSNFISECSLPEASFKIIVTDVRPDYEMCVCLFFWGMVVGLFVFLFSLSSTERPVTGIRLVMR